MDRGQADGPWPPEGGRRPCRTKPNSGRSMGAATSCKQRSYTRIWFRTDRVKQSQFAWMGGGRVTTDGTYVLNLVASGLGGGYNVPVSSMERAGL
jgi:hypothetical protein